MMGFFQSSGKKVGVRLDGGEETAFFPVLIYLMSSLASIWTPSLNTPSSVRIRNGMMGILYFLVIKSGRSHILVDVMMTGAFLR